ncbi:hypothetical protein THASP1DRAFT_30280 [Thamnocephalis sphaerospora]|uniref:Uncharacterized protein n=1 Tax=Thamnocephalis sphaerospora TaxID=78915 RepID=A0A4P9XPT6_9FUNG|nr:hypothetical protein THASP1DRAFT_30280 [Thamnocephalis sphaerospora]|eukprot:RKP07902.1 hypothetical protein THASP1DRAFT_30280 [Thamnocephalis sphaerospora]
MSVTPALYSIRHCARTCARSLAVTTTRHASVLTSVPATATSTAAGPTAPMTKTASASRPAGLAQPLGAAAAAQRTMSAWPAEAQPAELRFILSASRGTPENTNVMSPSARRARAARAHRMLAELESTLDASRQVLTRLEGREQGLGLQAAAAQPVAATTVASSYAAPAFAGNSNGSSGHSSDHDAHDTASTAEHSDRFVTAALFAVSGFIGYAGYCQRDEPLEVFADGRYPQQERLPLLSSWER